MIEMQNWNCEETPIEFVRPGRRERMRLFIKRSINRVKKVIHSLIGIFGIFCILFIVVMGSQPYKESTFDKNKSEQWIQLDKYEAQFGHHK